MSTPLSSPVIVPGDVSGQWYGSEALAVKLPANGRWRGMGANHRYRDKTWFWRRGYRAGDEPRPALTLSGVRISEDDAPQDLVAGRATNAMGEGWQQMLALVEFPNAGCWRVTATYTHAGIAQELVFVVEVAD